MLVFGTRNEAVPFSGLVSVRVMVPLVFSSVTVRRRVLLVGVGVAVLPAVGVAVGGTLVLVGVAVAGAAVLVAVGVVVGVPPLPGAAKAAVSSATSSTVIRTALLE